jgi:hypothetical protein
MKNWKQGGYPNHHQVQSNTPHTNKRQQLPQTIPGLDEQRFNDNMYASNMIASHNINSQSQMPFSLGPNANHQRSQYLQNTQNSALFNSNQKFQSIDTQRQNAMNEGFGQRDGGMFPVISNDTMTPNAQPEGPDKVKKVARRVNLNVLLSQLDQLFENKFDSITSDQKKIMLELCDKMNTEQAERVKGLKPVILSGMQESTESILESFFNEDREAETKLELLEQKLASMNKQLEEEIEELKRNQSLQAIAFYDKMILNKGHKNPNITTHLLRLKKERLERENQLLREKIMDFNFTK